MCAKLCTVAASNKRSCVTISLAIACSCYTYSGVILHAHPIPFVVNHTINATPPERLQQRHESFEGLNSSLAQFAAELWLAEIWPEMSNNAFCVTFFIFGKCFLALILVSVVLANQSRALKMQIIA